MKEAMLYETLPDDRVRCHLCAHQCVIADGHLGLCQVRENRGGTLITRVYGRTIAQNVDPIEKKPLYHFCPGSTAFSVATPGCNFRCGWCQNAAISQMPREGRLDLGTEASPEALVQAAQGAGCRSIAYTYTEPTVFFEYACDTARLAHAAGLANLFVTNGYLTPEALETLRPHLDAANVDLKAFRDATYRRHVGARLQPVLDALTTMKRLGLWIEVTTLVIPGINDTTEELADAARFLAQDLGPDTPWHLSRFTPAHKMTDVPPTPEDTLRRARQIGLDAGLHHVYIGNVPETDDTLCSRCQAVLIRRSPLGVTENRVGADGACPHCGTPVPGVKMAGP